MDGSMAFRTALRASRRTVIQLRPNTLSTVRCIHSSPSTAATPLAHSTTTGPPPEPPQPAVTSTQDRVARKLKQAELLKKGREARANPAQPSSALRKRFYSDVSVKESTDGLQVFLDTRPVRTASKAILTLPRNKRALATAIALEWDLLVSAQQALKHHYIPLTSLTSRAVDIEAADQAGNGKIRQEIVQMLMRYLGTDTLLCWAPERNVHDDVGLEQREDSGETLRGRQIETSRPIMAYLSAHVWPGAEIVPILETDSILPTPQPDPTQQIVKGWINDLPAFELAALERAVLATKSLLISARLVAGWSESLSRHTRSDSKPRSFGIEEAAHASTLEVAWQTRMWGEVEDTHDVDKEDIRRQLGSAILLISGADAS